MLNWIISFALKNRALVLTSALLVAGYGIYQALHTPIDVLPDMNRPRVTIMTEAHALVPEDIERLVSRPIEQVMNGATGVTQVRSGSGLGMSVVQIDFEWGTNIYTNRQIVQEKLQLAQAKLPTGVEVQMAPISSIMGQVQLIGIQSKSGNTDATKLRALVDQQVKPRLLSVAGVAQIVSIGGAPRQLQINVDADKLRIFNVTLAEVAEAVKGANANASGGFMNIGAEGPIITYTGRIAAESELAHAVVKPDPVRPVRIEDVAKVEFGPAAIRTGEAGVNAKPGVIMVIFKQPGTDTVELTQRVNKELADLQSTVPTDVIIIDNVFQQSAFITRAVNNVVDAVRDGGILVVIILFIFLLNFRTTLITLTAIPLSIAITAIVFAAFNLSINTMTLGGLAVAIGALVDDAIVDVENVFRRLGQNSKLPHPRHPLWVIFKASSEVRNPILIGTLLVVVVYLPLFFLTGMEGRLFTPIGIAYIVSTLASLVVSLTVTPVLCYYLLGTKKQKGHGADNWMVRQLKRVAGSAIRFSMAYPAQILGTLMAMVIIGMVILFTRGSQFLPSFNEGTAQVNLILPPNTSLDTSDAYGKRMDLLLKDIKGISNFGRRTGRAEGDEHAEGVNATETIVSFDPKSERSREEVVNEIRTKLAEEFPGVASEVEQPLAHMLSHLLSGVNAQVAIKIYGPDLDVLRSTAKEIEAAIKPIPGVKDLFAEQQEMIDQIEIKPKREQLARAGLISKDVGETIELAGGGEALTNVTINQLSYPVIVRLDAKDRQNLDNLRNLYVRAQGGGLILLSDIADVRLAKTPNTINRENVSRRMVVQHNVAGRSLGEVVGDVEKALKPIRERLSAMPGYSVRISGQFEAQAQATRLIGILSIVSLVMMFMILFMHFKSVNLSIQVLMSIPMAFVGAVAYIVISRQTMSVATLVGLISLGGIAARNAILLIDHYLHLLREENEKFTKEMIVRGGQERMVPVLMTALCSGIALVPLALSPDEPGREILYPVATVLIGGLISSTLMNFLVTPGLFWAMGGKEAERLAIEPQHQDKAGKEMAEDFELLEPVPDRPIVPKEDGGVVHA